jgi:hypothetical protein
MCNVATWFHSHNVYVLACILCLVGVSKATSCGLWRERYDPQGGNFGASQIPKNHIVLTSNEYTHQMYIIYIADLDIFSLFFSTKIIFEFSFGHSFNV